MKLSLRWLVLFAVPLATTTGCTSQVEATCSEMVACDSSLLLEGEPHGVADDGRIALTAREAWPTRAEEPPPLTAREIAETCTVLAACMPFGAPTAGAEARSAYLTACATVNPYEERVIPFGSNYYDGAAASDFLPGNQRASERWTFFAREVLAAHGNCAAVHAILTPRPDEVSCEASGCWWYSTELPIPSVRCSGDIATLYAGNRALERDCARAYLQCDESSPTGCTDRQPSACIHGALDRCDGSVRLGCDRYGRVTFHDCGRVEGGECAQDATGTRCVYPKATSCAASGTSCAQGRLTVCAEGRETEVDCEALGLGACTDQDGTAFCPGW